MIRGMNRPAAALGAFWLASALATSPALGQEKSAAAKALEANPGLKTTLDTPTFRKLKAELPKVKIGAATYYFAEGDLRLDEPGLMFYAGERDDQLRRHRDAKLGGLPSTAPSPGDLVSATVGGQVARFTPGSTLTYCVLKDTFESDANYRAAVDNMKAATREWSQACNIKFQHEVSQDETAAAAEPPAGITFTVRFVNPDDPADAPIASAFFPGDPRTDHHVLIFPDYFKADLIFDKVGVLRHELGHSLGFRHEHIRKEAPPVCQGESVFNTIAQTEYDPRSVMHYFCGGLGSRELKISLLDRRGARKVYGDPIGTLGATPPAGPLDADPAFKDTFQDVPPVKD